MSDATIERLLYDQIDMLRARNKELEAALKDARTYVEASSLNMVSKDGRKNYRQSLARIDAALAE